MKFYNFVQYKWLHRNKCLLFQKRNAWIASSFGDFDEGNAKKTKQVNIDHSFKKGKYLQFLYGIIAYKQKVVP